MLKRALVIIYLLLFIIIFNAFLNPFPKKNVPEGFGPRYGISYSFEQAEWYGLDSRKAYINLLDQVKVDWVRLPFFWDHPSTTLRTSSSTTSGQSSTNLGNIDDLKFGIEEAKKRNVKVIIALGAKTPYYPEYHLPKDVAGQIKFGETISLKNPVTARILEIDKKVVETLSAYDNIEAWQVENEPFLANINNWKIGKDLLAAEAEAVRATDPLSRPIILNSVAPTLFDSSYKSLLKILKPGDILGVNAYFKTQGVYLFSFSIFDKEVHVPWPSWLVWPVQSWVGFSVNFGDLRDEATNAGVKLWVLEMQAEPYVRTLDDAKRNLAYEPGDIVKADGYLKSSMVESIGLWGAPFWQFRQKNGDNSWIEMVQNLVNSKH